MIGGLIYPITRKSDNDKIMNNILGHTLFIILFGIFYYLTHLYLEKDGFVKANSEKEISLWDCIHFSIVTQTTVGYGGLIPMGPIMKFVNAIQLFTIFGIIVINLI